jgi:pimeloyl-ACP methyl ester carboxylesterase
MKLAPVQTSIISGTSVSYRRLGSGSRKVLFFHGFPGSSAQVEPFRSFVDSFDLDVVCMDRPGYHLSLPLLSSIAHSQQACELALGLVTSFGWKSWEVIAVSGGTPHLVEFVKAYPDFVSRVSVVCGLGPIGQSDIRKYLNWKSVLALRVLPSVPSSVLKKVSTGSGDVKPTHPAVLLLIQMLLPSSASDRRAIVEKPLNQLILQTALSEAFLQKGVGPKSDAEFYLSKSAFDLGDYSGAVNFWHGDQDLILPLEMAKKMVKQLPSSVLNVIPGEGHYSIAFNHLERVLRS